MPKYIAKTQTWLSHENRMVKADEVFTTTFPKVMVDGKPVDMKLGGNIELVKEESAKAEKAEKTSKAGADQA